jgi:hypothetical protein
MKYINYFLRKNLSVGAVIKKQNVGYDEFEVVSLVGDWATVRSIYSAQCEVLTIDTLCDEYRYYYTRKKVKASDGTN